MIKKRFKYNVNTDAIERDNEFFAYLNVVNVNRIVDLLNDLNDENEQLKQQLLTDDVCGICKYEYLVPSGNFFIGKCKKGHKECSKEDIKYCKDFELKGDVE